MYRELLVVMMLILHAFLSAGVLYFHIFLPCLYIKKKTADLLEPTLSDKK